MHKLQDGEQGLKRQDQENIKDGILLLVATLTDLETVILAEVSQTQKDKT